MVLAYHIMLSAAVRVRSFRRCRPHRELACVRAARVVSILKLTGRRIH